MAALDYKSNFINKNRVIPPTNWSTVEQSKEKQAIVTVPGSRGVAKITARSKFQASRDLIDVFVSQKNNELNLVSADFIAYDESFQSIRAFRLVSIQLYCKDIIGGAEVIEATDNELISNLVSGLNTKIDPLMTVPFNFEMNNSIYVKNFTTNKDHIFNFFEGNYFFEDKIINLIQKLHDVLVIRLSQISNVLYSTIFTSTNYFVIFINWNSQNFDINISNLKNRNDNFYTIFSRFFELEKVEFNYIYGINTGTALFFKPTNSTFGGLNFQNGYKSLSIHSQKLTQYRDKESLNYVDGNTVIGFIDLTSYTKTLGAYGDGLSFNVNTGDLVSNIVSFDPTIFLDEIDVSIKTISDDPDLTANELKLKEAKKAYINLTFEVW